MGESDGFEYFPYGKPWGLLISLSNNVRNDLIRANATPTDFRKVQTSVTLARSTACQ